MEILLRAVMFCGSDIIALRTSLIEKRALHIRRSEYSPIKTLPCRQHAIAMRDGIIVTSRYEISDESLLF
jgi:hypothetical protein